MRNPPFTGKGLKGGDLRSTIEWNRRMGKLQMVQTKTEEEKRSYKKVVPGFEPGLTEIK